MSNPTPLTPPAPSATAPHAGSTRGALAGLSLSMLLSSLGMGVVNVGLPALAQAFGATFQQVQWVVLAYLLVITTWVVSAGRLGDRVGRPRLLLAGLALFTAATVACAAAPSLGWLVAARALQGLGGAAMMALTLALVGETVPRDRVGRAMGLLATSSALGTALGPSVGGLLIAGFGWRALFVVLVPLGGLAAWLVQRHLPPAPQVAVPAATLRGPQAFDLPGTLLLAGALASYMLAMTLGRGGFGALNAAALCIAAALLAAFVRNETRAPAPLLRLSLLREPALRASLATSALVSTVTMATLIVGPFYLSQALGLDAAALGVVMAAGPLAVASTSLPAGRLVDRLGAARMTLAGLSAVLLGSLGLAGVPPGWGVAGYVVALVVTTTGYALFQTANNTATMKDVPPERRGVVSALLNLARNLGHVTGASAMGAVYAWGSAGSAAGLAPGAAATAGQRATFGLAAVLMALAIGIALLARRREA